MNFKLPVLLILWAWASAASMEGAKSEAFTLQSVAESPGTLSKQVRSVSAGAKPNR